MKKLAENAKIPVKGSEGAAGYDLYACMPFEQEIYTVDPHTTTYVGTGISVAIPKGCFGAIFARSGLASKCGLRPANCVGVIDSDYRGEIIVALHNDRSTTGYFHNGDRIAQLVIMPCFNVDFIETDDLDATERGDGGFGSTGMSGYIYIGSDEDSGQTSIFNSDGSPVYYTELHE